MDQNRPHCTLTDTNDHITKNLVSKAQWILWVDEGAQEGGARPQMSNVFSRNQALPVQDQYWSSCEGVFAMVTATMDEFPSFEEAALDRP